MIGECTMLISRLKNECALSIAVRLRCFPTSRMCHVHGLVIEIRFRRAVTTAAEYWKRNELL